MHTRCPGCQAVYELHAAVLADASGVVRCGNCGKTFNTLSQLFENHPDESDEPLPSSGMPPLLEHPDLVQAELPVHIDEPEPESEEPEPALFEEPRPGPLAGRAWLVVAAILVVALGVQLAMFWQSPRWPLAAGGGGDGPTQSVDPAEAIQIVSRDMHAHPSLDDAVIVSIGLRNQHSGSIRFPNIEIRFFDASQQLLGARRLGPKEYLHDDRLIESGMPADTIIPVLMEFVIEGSEPTGFQLRLF
ncbi:MAG: DUF3426 domain-containing protein [Wenzhouxiangella sp.]